VSGSPSRSPGSSADFAGRGSYGACTDRGREILSVAARIFRVKGFAGTTIQEIADEVGMLKGSLYYHFSSKEELLYLVIKQAVSRGLDAMARWRQMRADPLTRLRAAVHLLSIAFMEEWETVSVFFQDYRYLTPEHRALIDRDRAIYNQFLVDVIREGQSAGVMDPDADPELSATALAGMMNSICAWYRPSDGTDPDRIARELADIAVAALMRVTGPTRRSQRAYIDLTAAIQSVRLGEGC
jgi:TetR/AcrR family transcriptional regulator, cholesterol catabolism regulator